MYLTDDFTIPVLDYTPISVIPCAFSQISVPTQYSLYICHFCSIGDNLSIIYGY